MKNDSNPPSDLFADLVCDAGTPSTYCNLCGRYHFATGPQSCEDERELERLLRLADEKPNAYVASEYDSISCGQIAGMTAVYDCPCNGLRKYEDFIWENRELIIKYIRKRTAAEMKAAEKTADLLTGI